MDLSLRLPKDIQYIIASFSVVPVYRLADCLTKNIYWDGLCSNPHPGMIPLIDAYFERCLTVQSHLDRCMLERLTKNPTAFPLLKKYNYHLIQSKIDIDWNKLQEPYKLNSWDESMDLQENLNCYPHIIELVKNGTLSIRHIRLGHLDLLYQNPAIFELDSDATKKAEHKFITEIFN